MDVDRKRRYSKPGRQTAKAEAESLTSFNRRAALNTAVGMTARCPYAFQLSEEELAEAEAILASGNGDRPIPIWTEPNGLRILGDPWRGTDRPDTPPLSSEDRREKYAGGKYAAQIQS